MTAPVLPATDLRLLADARDMLRTISDGAAPVLETLLPIGRELTRSERFGFYCIAPVGSVSVIEFVHWLGMPIPTTTFVDEFAGFLRSHPAEWHAFSVAHPEPCQRNVVLTLDRLLAMDKTASAIMERFFPRWGLADRDQMRALVCDGPSLLAWAGGFRPERYGRRERAALRALIPDLKRRLMLERDLGTTTFSVGGFATVLDHLSCPAYVVKRDGAIELANELGRVQLSGGGRHAARAEVRAACQGKTALGPALGPGLGPGLGPALEPRSIEVIPLGSPGVHGRALVLCRGASSGIRRGVAAAARKWGLSRRQAEVLDLVADGHPNKTIAARLCVAERTVEFHLAAIFSASQTANRSTLLATLLATFSKEA